MPVVAGVLVAVVGWIVNQWLARRALRRNMRIEYLLSAYRRLEHASNRMMTGVHKSELEEALSDIQLLGSAQQVTLATEFAERFATEQQASTEPLLQDLRASLRRELLLEPVPPQKMWLRIDAPSEGKSDGPSMWTSASAQWKGQEARVNQALSQIPTRWVESTGSGGRSLLDEMCEFARTTPLSAIRACHRLLMQALADLLSSLGADRLTESTLTELAHLACDDGLIVESVRDGVEGLDVMYHLASVEPSRIGVSEAREYAALTEGILFALRRSPR